MIIAIDGPSGAGKSSVADQVADMLGIRHLDTGAMYRAVTVLALKRGVSEADADELAKLAALPIHFEDVPEGEGESRVIIGDQDVTSDIRNKEISVHVTPICQHAQVRAELVAQQQKIGSAGNFVVDGRDISTVVFPDAELKIYLDADIEVRAQRRYEQDLEKGKDVTYEEELESMICRDTADSTRDIAPLKEAEGAIRIDSTHMTKDEVAEKIVNLAREFL